MLELFLSDSWEGKPSSGKHSKLAKVSQDTATRDLAHLVEIGALDKRDEGRSTHRVLVSRGGA